VKERKKVQEAIDRLKLNENLHNRNRIIGGSMAWKFAYPDATVYGGSNERSFTGSISFGSCRCRGAIDNRCRFCNSFGSSRCCIDFCCQKF
jgi:hypothetical protein